jgi:hypothetical protein
MSDLLKIQLANAIEVEPSDIRDVRSARDGGYNIVLMNYQKFRNIEPLAEEAAEEVGPSEFAASLTVKSDTSPQEVYIVPGAEIYIPDDLRKAYVRPRRATIAKLKELLVLLEVAHKSNVPKKQLVKLVNDWKLEHAP